MAYSHSSLIQVRVIGFRMLWVYGKAKQPARQLQAPLLPVVRSKLISNPEPPHLSSAKASYWRPQKVGRS